MRRKSEDGRRRQHSSGVAARTKAVSEKVSLKPEMILDQSSVAPFSGTNASVSHCFTELKKGFSLFLLLSLSSQLIPSK